MSVILYFLDLKSKDQWSEPEIY